jgi:catechol 2,3-dioxygenase-like lactoylglutathione lyase family enzyme
VDVLSSRILLRPSSLDRSRRFYRDRLGLATCREFGPPDDPGLVFFPGQGLLEVSGHAAGPPGRSVMIWIQVRDVHAEHARLAPAGVPVVREPVAEPWGLIEMWIEDPDGVRIVLVEVPADHPVRRDPATGGGSTGWTWAASLTLTVRWRADSSASITSTTHSGSPVCLSACWTTRSPLDRSKSRTISMPPAAYAPAGNTIPNSTGIGP